MAKGRKTGGRQKGAGNKNTKALKDMILGALTKAGGEKYLLDQARKNPGAFLTLIGKVLPTTIAGEKGADPVQVEHKYPPIDWQAVWAKAGLSAPD